MSMDRNKGLRPAVAASCRRALREAVSDSRSVQTRQHLQECSFCSARIRTSASLADWCSERPDVPSALSSESVLEGILERVTESSEEGSIGAWIQSASAESLADDASQSTWVETVGSESVNATAIGDFIRGPQQPDPHVWLGVRRSILAGVASARTMRRRLKPMSWRVLLAGAAAAALIGLIVTSGGPSPQPTIVFADLDRAPDVDFAIVRYGARY